VRWGGVVLVAAVACGNSSEAPDAPSDASGTSLPPSGTTFVFLRSHALRDPSLEIWAYDVSTGQERLVTDLVENGAGHPVHGVAISPDRNRIAFASSYGATADEIAAGTTDILWTVGLDGTDFRRVTPPSADGAENPAWSPDGLTIAYDGPAAAGRFPFTIAAGGGTPVASAFDPVCGQVMDVAIRPTGDGFLAVQSACLAVGHDGLALYPNGGSTTPTRLVINNGAGEVDVSITKPSWVSDGSGFMFVATGTFTFGGNNVLLPAAYLYSIAGGTFAPLVTPPDANTEVLAAALSPDGRFLVECSYRIDTQARDLVLADLRGGLGVTQLTHDGVSCEPSW